MKKSNKFSPKAHERRRGRPSKRSSLPRWNGYPGSTTIACLHLSAISHPRKPRQTIIGHLRNRSQKRPDLNQTASTNPRAAHLDFGRTVTVYRVGKVMLLGLPLLRYEWLATGEAQTAVCQTTGHIGNVSQHASLHSIRETDRYMWYLRCLALAITNNKKRCDEGAPLFIVRVDGVVSHL